MNPRPGTSGEEILARLDAQHRLAVLHGEDQAPPTMSGWDAQPAPLRPRRLLRPFPVDALPPWVAEQVIAVAEFTQTPLDLPGSLALAALATAAGGRAVTEIRPGWRNRSTSTSSSRCRPAPASPRSSPP